MKETKDVKGITKTEFFQKWKKIFAVLMVVSLFTCMFLMKTYALDEVDSSTDTAYVVNHYVHDLGTDTYTLNSTDNNTGTSDASVTLADLKKTIPGFTYVDGYLTGDTTKPTSGAVETTTISPDGTRVINLYYRRNYLYIQYDMNGGSLADEHGVSYGTSGSLITLNSDTKCLRGVYGSKVGSVNITTIELSENTYNYDGKQKEPEVTVIDNNGNVIPADEYEYERTMHINNISKKIVVIDGEGNGKYIEKLQNLLKLDIKFSKK